MVSQMVPWILFCNRLKFVGFVVYEHVFCKTCLTRMKAQGINDSSVSVLRRPNVIYLSVWQNDVTVQPGFPCEVHLTWYDCCAGWHHLETFSALLAFGWVIPHWIHIKQESCTGIFGFIDVGLKCCEQIVDLPLIWDTMTLRWRHFNAFPSNEAAKHVTFNGIVWIEYHLS